MASPASYGAADAGADADAQGLPLVMAARPRGADADRASDPGSTLLPAPVANLVSFATRSTGLAIRIGGAIGGYGLDVAKLTTLSSIGLGRAFLEGVLGRAGMDAISRSDSEMARANSETILERAVEGLHHAMDQMVFWTAASFEATSTTLSVVSQTSQLLLSTLDQFFGSTDSSRAMASIITMIRREFQNPATGQHGETVSVADLVMVLCGVAYLQRSCRSLLEEEARSFGTEEIVWDVVVPSGAVLTRSSHEESLSGPRSQTRNRESSAGHMMAALRTHGMPDDSDYHDDGVSELQLEREILRCLPDNAKVSITRETATSEIIRVNVISDAQPVSVEPPPGVELVEENRVACQAMSESKAEQGNGHESRITCSQFVFRQERRRERRTSFEKVDGNISHVAGYVEELNAGFPKISVTEHGNKTRSPTPSTSGASTPTASLTPRQMSRYADRNGDGQATRTGRRVDPSTLASRPSISRRQSWSESLTYRSKETVGPGSALLERKGGFKSVLKKSMSIFNKDDTGSDVAAGKRRRTLAGSLSTTTREMTEMTRNAPSLAASSRRSPSRSRKGASLPAERTPEELRNPSTLTPRSSFITVHESVRQSTVSLTETYSIPPSDDYGPPSEFNEATASLVAQDIASDGEDDSPQAIPHKSLRRMKSQSPSIYTLSANKSESSLIAYHAYPEAHALSAADTLSTLRQEGIVDGMFPRYHLLRNVTRYMRFASASYGSGFLKLLGIAKKMPIPKVVDDTHHELRSFAHHTRSDPSSILLSSFIDPNGGSDGTGSTNTGVPLVHYISLDHESRAVVLACRGTLGFEDVLTDMTCEYDDLVWRGKSYKVHKGVHASAKRLLYGRDGRVLYTLKAALEEFPDYGLVLTGHSLGGAVTSLLGVMLSEPGPYPGSPFVTSSEPHTQFLLLPPPPTTAAAAGNAAVPTTPPPNHVCLPPGRPIHVYAYGPPATMSAPLRDAARGLITTIVHGNDLVPCLSLGILHDLQAAALALKSDNSAAKTELRRRVWKGLVGGALGKTGGSSSTTYSMPSLSSFSPWAGWGSSVNRRDHGNAGSAGHGGGDGDDDDDEQWAYATLKVLRASMMSAKLVPPGEVFVVEGEAGPQGGGEQRPGQQRRVVLKYVRDVERRFREVRFGKGMLTDHSPGRYEAALEALMGGVLGTVV